MKIESGSRRGKGSSPRLHCVLWNWRMIDWTDGMNAAALKVARVGSDRDLPPISTHLHTVRKIVIQVKLQNY